ncbi:MAG: PD40 domain-containing protein [Planctomycetes bacterium]|nr:PD40 domain-containing protein [Planctomycetota bacterium]
MRAAEISRDGRPVVAGPGAGGVLVGAAGGEARALAVYGSFDPSVPVEREVTVSDGASELAVSPDGESIAFVADGDIYVLRKHDKIERCVRVTTAPEPDGNPVWVEEGKALLFLSERDGNSEIYRVAPAEEETPFYLARRFVEQRLTSTEVDELSLSAAPNGELLAWIEYPGKLQVAGAEDRVVRRVLTDGFDTPDYSWAPDSRWIAYSKVDEDYNTEVYLVRAAVEEGAPEDAPGVVPFNLTRHPDDDSAPRWSPDGRKLVFTSRREMLDETDVWVAWLRKGDTELTERERLEAEEAAKKAKAEAKKAKAKAKKEPAAPADPAAAPEPGAEPGAAEPAAQEPAAAPEGGEKPQGGDEEGDEDEDENEKPEVEPVVIDFADIHLRIERLTRREGNEDALGFDADSEKVYFNSGLGTRLTSGTDGVDTGFYAIDLFEKKEEKLEPSSVSSFTAHGKEVYYVKGGKVTGRGSKATTYGFSVRYRRDQRELRRAVMEQAWRVLDRGFYDPGFHGHDWSASLEEWRPLALAASTGEDFGEFVNWMLGEMNASHMGYYGGGGTQAAEIDSTATGDLGVTWDDGYSGPGRRVREVVKGGPASREASRLAAGDVVLAVNGQALAEGGNFYRAMVGTVGRETELQVRGSAGEERSLLVRPQSSGALGGLLYRRAAEQARSKVEHASGGKLGYIHIEGMGTPSLLEFERDLYHAGAGKEALLIDVRENGGGWTTDMVLSMLMVNDHAITVPRGGGQGYPQGRRVFATWNKPVVVLCNENSYSNAEIFSWAIKTLGRGPVVGKQTYGAVISTGGAGLLDGSFVRLPMRGWYVNDGNMTNMELNGCPPDFPVENLPGDYAAEIDRQLEKAIEVGLQLARSGS